MSCQTDANSAPETSRSITINIDEANDDRLDIIDASTRQSQVSTKRQTVSSLVGQTESMRRQVGARTAAAESSPLNCDKNKQKTSDAPRGPATSASQAASQQVDDPTQRRASNNAIAGHVSMETGEVEAPRICKYEDEEKRSDKNLPRQPTVGEFKLPIPKEQQATTVSTSSITNDLKTVETPAQVETTAKQPRRVPQRKASVFSYDGFPGLHELDQKALKQHAAILSNSSGNLAIETSANTTNSNNNRLEELTQRIQKQSEKIVVLQQQHQQQQVMAAAQQAANCGAELGPPKGSSATVETSPRRPARSDTLGSTGSSRASSCDEPTIVSPTPKPTPQNIGDQATSVKRKSSIQTNATESSNSSLESINIDASLSNHLDSATPKQVQQDATMTIEDQDSTKLESTERKGRIERTDISMPMEVDCGSRSAERKMSTDSSNASSSDDVFDSELSPRQPQQPRKPVYVPPPFESIKTQIKKNSVLDAKTIGQHIDRLISQNEALIENYNQVSIRSYNSQASRATVLASPNASPSCLTSPKSLKNLSGDDVCAQSTSSASTSAQAPKRPIKQRWSTTALYQGNVFNQQHQQLQALRLQHTSNQQANINLAEQSVESRKATQDSLNQLVEARLRKRSYNNQFIGKRTAPVRQSSEASAINTMLLSPSIFAHHKPVASSLSNTEQHQLQQFTFDEPVSGVSGHPSNYLDTPASMPSSPKPPVPASSLIDVQNFLANRFKKDQEHSVDQIGCDRGAILNPSIESAIKNLSLKRNENGQHSMLHTSDDILMAGILVERQRQQQQQILEEHIRQQQQQIQTSNQEASIPTNLLEFYQQQQLQQLQFQQRQQQQQALEQQMNLNRLAALEREYQQQLTANILATSHQQQPQELGQLDSLNERQARESLMLNEFLSKMMQLREHPQQQQQQQRATQRVSLPIISHQGPIVRHSIDQRSSEMFTQPLDSATPSHRCTSCDISFWTRDLLNYHMMTSCSARTGPEPARPLAFNFAQPNGFDRMMSDPEGDNAAVLDMTSRNKQSSAIFQNHNHQQQNLTPGEPVNHSKSVSPPRRRTYHEMEAPNQDLLQIPAHHRLTGLTNNFDCSGVKQTLVAPKSPHSSRESAEQTWQQRLNDLYILKQQLLTTAQPKASTSTSASASGNSHQESSLPIKKRKISEPNMRY